MAENYSRGLLRISVAQICQNLGWNSAQSSSLEVLTDVLERYLLQLGGVCHRYSEQFGRTEPTLDDLGLAFKHMCIDVSELEDYVHHVDPVPFAHELVAFPARKSASLEFPNPQSREILHHRKEHVDSHLPYMFPHLKDEVPNDIQNTSMLSNGSALKEEPKLEDASLNDETVGEKRLGTNGSLEMPPSKRQRIGNPSFPDEAGQSQYEMTCVFMNKNGVLTTRPGCQGKMPEARMPPPNPRNIIENKENKAKESGNGSSGISVEGIVKSSKSGKSSKKSSHKKNFHHLHESAAKAALEMTSKEIGKKSASSKAAAKFIKKLKSSKKSAKIFGKKNRDSKSQDDFDSLNSSHHESIKDGHKVKSGKKKKKEKKSAAIIDSDEELRNLCSPSSSKVPSPEHSAIIGGGDTKLRATMEAINDSINAVLRDGHDDSSKVKKKKKKESKPSVEIKPAEIEAVKTPKRKGRPPKKDKKPEPPPPPPVDIKPFFSDKYSSAELKVYEFDDSPPDSIKSRRPSAPDENPVPSKSNSSRSSSHSHQKSSRIVEQEELFAPEIKFETVKPLKLELNAEKEKNMSKDEKKEKSSGDKDKQKIKNAKDTKLKDKTKEDGTKEKLKDKEVKKDKKDKKKDKEKKKKHKEKDRDRDKEKEKRREEKVKQEAKESRESSPVGFGVKLKIKIGGSAGPSSSMMLTEDHSATPSPVPPPSDAKRESMSPPKVIPKLYISKKGQEEKTKKSSTKHGSSSSKYKSSPLAVSTKSGSQSPSSNAASPSHSNISSTPHSPPRKTPTPPPPPPFAQYSDHHKSHSPVPRDSTVKESLKKSKGEHVSRKDKNKKKGLKSSSLKTPAAVAKPKAASPRRTRQSSSSLEHSPPPPPPPVPPSPRISRSRSQSLESPSPTRRIKHSSPSPSNSKSSRRHQSPSPSKPPTPGSTSPNAMLDWNLHDSPLHHSPTPTMPNSPGSRPNSPSHSSIPRTPNPHRSPSPTENSPHTSPITRAMTPEVGKINEVPSPASSGKSSVGAKSRTVETETICVFYDDTGQKVWICPACKLQDDGSEMIGCDGCDNWYHWPCVGITQAPPEEQSWFCTPCTLKSKSSTRGGSRGRGRPRGRGRGRGKKKIT